MRTLDCLLLGLASLILDEGARAQTTWQHVDQRIGACTAPFGLGLANMSVLQFGGADPATGELFGDLYRYRNNTWTRLPTLTRPSARTDAGMAALNLTIGARAYLFGGRTAVGADASTWVFDGADWTQVPAAAPPARHGHALVADTRRNRLVLFGGFDGVGWLDDTWEFDPTNLTWTAIAMSTASPAPRRDHAMAYDPTADLGNGQVVLFGGGDGQTRFGDTWTYQFGQWSLVPIGANPSPSPRRQARMAFHPGSSTVVLFGGDDGIPIPSDETWVFDGASSTWSLHTPPAPGNRPPARWGQTLQYDPLSLDVVMTQGQPEPGKTLRGTWRWNNFAWVESPVLRTRRKPGLAYREADASVVLFGGLDGSTYLADTWELRNGTWAQQSTPTAPSARTDVGLVHDALHDRTVLFGGRNGATVFGDAWEWANGAWQPITPPVGTAVPGPASSTQPVYDSARSTVWLPHGSDMWRLDDAAWQVMPRLGPRTTGGCLDAARGRLVIFGGLGVTGVLGDMWQWDGVAWRATAGALPDPRFGSSLVYDTSRSLVMMMSGDNGGAGGNSLGREVWSWNGTAWQQQANRSSSSLRAASAFDTLRAMLVTYGGDGTTTSLVEFNGITWSTINVGNQFPKPPGLVGATMAGDSARAVTLLFGGSTNGSGIGSVVAATWSWNGTAWTPHSPAASPPARSDAGMCFDATTQRVLLFGGYDGSGNGLADLWSWDGTTWSQVPGSTVGGPSPRGQMVVTRALSGPGCLVFGGQSNLTGTTFFDDLWRWDGAQWLLEYQPPALRRDYGAAYDSARDRVVMFGGSAGYGVGPYSNETWEWDGTAWLRRTPPVSPPARARCRLSYDSARNCTVLVGGTDGVAAFSDIWEWDGATWSQRTPVSPGPIDFVSVVYDRARGVTVGVDASRHLDYGPVTPARRIAYAQPCTTVIGTPRLQFVDAAGPWIGAPFPITAGPVPNPVFGYLAIGFTRLPTGSSVAPLLGIACDLHTPADITSFLLPAGGSMLAQTLDVPAQANLVGVAVYLQAAIAANAGWGMTDAVQCVIGSR